MNNPVAETAQTNMEFQRRMADSLVAASGLDAAIEFAALNGWQGVLCQLHRLDAARPGTQA